MKRILVMIPALLLLSSAGLAPEHAMASGSLSPSLVKNRNWNPRKPDPSKYVRRINEKANLTSSGSTTTHQQYIKNLRAEQRALQQMQLQERRFILNPETGTGAEFTTPHRRTGQSIQDNRIKYQDAPSTTYIHNVIIGKKDGPCAGLAGQKLALCFYRQRMQTQ